MECIKSCKYRAQIVISPVSDDSLNDAAARRRESRFQNCARLNC